MARPSSYSPEVAAEICRRLRTETVKEVCGDAGMPSRATFYDWIADYPEFADMYVRAREARAHAVSEEIIEIADTEEDSNKARVRIDARKWWLGKANAKHYGERANLDITQTLTINVAFEDYIRSLNEASEAKVINGTVAAEGRRLESLPAPIRSRGSQSET
jgi:hypothetical protein